MEMVDAEVSDTNVERNVLMKEKPGPYNTEEQYHIDDSQKIWVLEDVPEW